MTRKMGPIMNEENMFAVLRVATVAAGAVVMVIGYTIGRAYVYSTPEYAMLKLPFQILQAGFGAVMSIVLLYPLRLRAAYRHILHTR